MARERMVTRTVMVSEVTVMTVNTETAEVVNVVYEIGGGITDTNALLKAVKKAHESNTLKCVAVMGVNVKEVLYGMPEAEFISRAKILPPRGKEVQE